MQNMGIEVLFKGINSLRLWQGLWVTIRIALISMVFSIILGFLLGMVMNIPNKIIKFICRIYLEIVRIMPQLVLLFLVYFGAAKHLGMNLSGETAAVIVFTFWGTAEMGDLVRSALISIPKQRIRSWIKQMAGLSLYYPSADYKKTSSIRSESSYPNDQDHITGSSYRSSRGVKSWKTDHRCITLYKSDSGPLGIRCSILYVFYHMFSIFQTLQSTGKEVC